VLTSQTRFRIETPRVVHETFDDEVVIIDFETGSYYSLDKVGTHVWSLIERGATLGEIVESLARSYHGSRPQIESAVQRFTSELQEQNLVSPAGAGPSPQPEAADRQADAEPSAEHAVFEPPVLQEYTDMQELLLLDPIHEVDDSGWPNIPDE
jgi:hypothetical protein